MWLCFEWELPIAVGFGWFLFLFFNFYNSIKHIRKWSDGKIPALGLFITVLETLHLFEIFWGDGLVDCWSTSLDVFGGGCSLGEFWIFRNSVLKSQCRISGAESCYLSLQELGIEVCFPQPQTESSTKRISAILSPFHSTETSKSLISFSKLAIEKPVSAV